MNNTDGSRRTTNIADEVVLTSVGLIFDGGLCADGVPADEWSDYAAGAVDVADGVYLATCTSEEWEGPQAVEVVAVVSAVGGLLYEIHDRGATVFDALSGEDRNRLLRASELIEAVARPSRDLRMHAQNETSP